MSTQNVSQLPLPTRAYIPSWTFADKLRKARLSVSMSQEMFAQQLGCKPSAYAQWEAGNNKPRELVMVAQQVQAVTGVAATWLLGIEPDGASLEHAKMAPTPKGEGQMLPEMDSNHQPAGIKPEDEDVGAEIIQFPARPASTAAHLTNEHVAPVTALYA